LGRAMPSQLPVMTTEIGKRRHARDVTAASFT
jgi:hypothetical protein